MTQEPVLQYIPCSTTWTLADISDSYTMGGVEIDTESRVIDTNGKVIKGVWACGEMGGGK